MATQAGTSAHEAWDREAWLTEAATIILDGIIMPVAAPFGRPTFRVTVGFSKHSRGSAKRRTIAQCFPREASTDNVNEIFVSPEIDDPMVVLPALTHELIHAVDNSTNVHRGWFTYVARDVGFVGLSEPGTKLGIELLELARALGAYPHARMDLDALHQKQSTRQLKIACSDVRCGFIARSSRKHADRWSAAFGGYPAPCPCCGSELIFPQE
jgi:hypothetical protein